MAQKKASVKLRVFNIENQNITTEIDIIEKLTKRLGSTTVNDRRMELSGTSIKGEEFFIPDYTILTKENILYGIKLKMSKERNAVVPKEIFAQKTFSIAEFKSLDDSALGTYSNHYHFALNNKHLIVNLNRSTSILNFQTYFNFLLEEHGVMYEFNPFIEAQENFKLTDLTSIKITDKSPKNSDKEIITNSKKALWNVSMDMLKHVFSDVRDLEKYQDVLSAVLLLNIKKPSKMNEEDFKKQYGALLKPMSDSDMDSINFIPKKGKIIKGNDLLKTEEVTIEKDASGNIIDQQIYQEMRRILGSL